MSKRLLPTGVCWCGCGQQIDLGSFFAPGHDKKAESRVIMEVFGGVPRFVDTFGYGPDGDQGAGTTWIDHVMRLRRVAPSVREKCALEHPDLTDRIGPMERTKFNIGLRLPLNLDGSLSLSEGSVAFHVPMGGSGQDIDIPFGDLTAVYKVSTPGPFWVVRTSGALRFDEGSVKYVPFGRDEPRGMTGKAWLRLKELGPLKDAAISAWVRLQVKHTPAFYEESKASEGGPVPATDHIKLGFQRWDGFEAAVAVLSDDRILKELCTEFSTAVTTIDELWFHARRQLGWHGNKTPLASDVYFQFIQTRWTEGEGQKLMDAARTAYENLLRHIDASVS